MDFRTCPACNASVLEDDVQDCPFCGASMSGKGGGKPKAKPAAATTKTAPSKPAAPEKKAAPKPSLVARKPDPRRPIGQTTADEENPFEVDTAAVRRAIPLSPKPTKSRTHRVVCEMCETPGFMNVSDAGKDVKCCNPKCMVPIFKSPAIEKQDEPEEEPRGWFTPLNLGIGVAVLLVAGIGTFFALRQNQPAETVNVDPLPAPKPKEIDRTQLIQQAVKEEEKPLTLAEIRKQSLVQIDKEANNRNRSRTAGYQLATEAHADGGDLAGAGELLSRLRKEARSAGFLQIQPLVRIALQHVAHGNGAEAGKLADTALKLASGIPNVDRQSLDSVASLAALLVQLGRTGDAKALISKQNDPGPRGLASLFWMSATEGESFDIDAEVRRPYHIAVANPLWVSVVETVASRGNPQAALQFCSEGPDVDTVDNCRAAWAGAVAGSAADAPDLIANAVSAGNFGPTANARLWAAVASRQALSGDSTDAAESLKHAQAAIASVPPVTAIAMPGMKAIYESRGKHHAGLPDPAPVRSTVLAYASIGVAQAQTGDQTAGWNGIVAALEAARGMAPTQAQTQQSVDEVAKQKQFVEDELVRLLKLNANDQPARFRAFNDYRNQVDNLHKEARARFRLEADILRAAVEAGLVQQAWDYILESSRHSDPARKQPYLESELPGFIKRQALVEGHSDLARSIDAAFAGKKVDMNIVDQVMTDATRLTAQGDLKKAGDLLGNVYRLRRAKNYADQLDVDVLRLCARLQKTRPAEQVMNEFILELRDPILKEDALRLLAARSMQTGKAPQVWSAINKQLKLEPTERAAMYRGFVGVKPAAQPIPATTSNSSAPTQ